MGQYYMIVNVDKKQALYSHIFGDGLKLMEFGSSGCGMMTGLALLLANSNGRGGGDFREDDELIGSWAGDRIVIAGDYAVRNDPGENLLPPVTIRMDGEADRQPLLYFRVWHDEEDRATGKDIEDISHRVLRLMTKDQWLHRRLQMKVNDYAREQFPDDLKELFPAGRLKPADPLPHSHKIEVALDWLEDNGLCSVAAFRALEMAMEKRVAKARGIEELVGW